LHKWPTEYKSVDKNTLQCTICKGYVEKPNEDNFDYIIRNKPSWVEYDCIYITTKNEKLEVFCLNEDCDYGLLPHRKTMVFEEGVKLPYKGECPKCHKQELFFKP